MPRYSVVEHSLPEVGNVVKAEQSLEQLPEAVYPLEVDLPLALSMEVE
jgi:hypothetical protein